MTGWKHIFTAICYGTMIAALLATTTSSSSASAVTLMVNGNTPSMRWQRYVERFYVPTAPGSVALYLSRCPWWPTDRDGCADAQGVWIAANVRDFGLVLRHELGHVFDIRLMTDATHNVYTKLWEPWPSTPAGLWWASFDQYNILSYKDIPAEHFAQVYDLCSRLPIRRITYKYIFEWGYDLSHGASHASVVRAVRRSCALIDRIGRQGTTQAP